MQLFDLYWIYWTILPFPKPQCTHIEQLDAISQGQFTRTYKQGQWDWNTVWVLLGRPSHGPANIISSGLGSLRKSLKKGNHARVQLHQGELLANDIKRFLKSFQPGGIILSGDVTGALYIASTRSQPNQLLITAARESVQNHIKRTNEAAGLLEPFGTRAIWKVSADAIDAVLGGIHSALSSYRVRADRDLFAMPYGLAFNLINDYLSDRRIAVGEAKVLVVPSSLLPSSGSSSIELSQLSFVSGAEGAVATYCRRVPSSSLSTRFKRKPTRATNSRTENCARNQLLPFFGALGFLSRSPKCANCVVFWFAGVV